jgi:uncharacterized protein YndB with AHSA1/START domain
MTHTIENSIEIAAPLATLRTAITTRDGFRAWFCVDTEVDSAGRYTLSFGPRVVTFAVDRADDRGIAMTCVSEQENPDWLGTELTITLTPLTDGKTRVDLRHAGYRSQNDTYARSIKGWAYFLTSLAVYATTGKGTPFEATAAPAPRQPSAVMA